MKKIQAKTLILQIIIILALIGAYFAIPKIKNNLEIKKIERANVETIEQIKDIKPIPKSEENNTQKDQELAPAKEAYLPVPFICQAPLQTEANWTLHEESCEEAAVLQTYFYEIGEEISREQANQTILDMIDWQKQNLGSHHDLYADEMVKFIEGYYQIEKEKIHIIYDATLDDIKKIITKGHPVIVPITGEILKNPYYPYPGYHMLVVIGYTQDRIITNDNGTRHGADFSYDNDVFYAAMQDAGGDIIYLEGL